MTIEFKGVAGFVFWCMLGLVSYLVIGDYTIFTWADPWLYVYMLFWPAVWVWFFFFWFMVLLGCVLLGVGLYTWWEHSGYHITRLFTRRNRR